MKGKDCTDTTMRGMSTTAAANHLYMRVKLSRFVSERDFPEAFRRAMRHYAQAFGRSDVDPEAVADQYLQNEWPRLRPEMAKYVGEEALFWKEARERGVNFMFEGAQGGSISVWHGEDGAKTTTDPMTTPKNTDYMIGVAKAFPSRVGGGNKIAAIIGPCESVVVGQPGAKGREVGTTTGRKRTVRYLDLPQLRTNILLSNVTHLTLTKLDVVGSLAGNRTLPVCTAYKDSETGQTWTTVPSNDDLLARMEPVYGYEVKLDFQPEDITKAETFGELPDSIRRYVDFIEESLERPVARLRKGAVLGQAIIREDRMPF